MPLSVAVTGLTGYIGKTLLALLEASPAVEHIVGIDTIEIPIRTPKLEFHTFDIRDDALGRLLTGIDVLVHLAFLVDPLRDETLMYDVNVGGFRNVLAAVEAGGVGKFVYPSSGHAYGAHPDNPRVLAEDAPLRPNVGLAYALHKAETEAILADWQGIHSDVSVTVARFARTLGPHVDNFMSRAFERPRFLKMKGHAPPFQAVHEDDAASALLHFVEADVPGTFNVCPDDVVEQRDVVGELGRGVLELPEDIAFPVADIAWRARAIETPPAELEFLMYPVVLANDRLRASGWKAAYSTADTITATIAARRAHGWSSRPRGLRANMSERARVAAYSGAGIVLAPLGARSRRP